LVGQQDLLEGGPQQALTNAAFYIANQPEMLQKLQDELKTAIPDSRAPLDWVNLEELPYLGGCIKEAIRLSYGVSARSARISPDKPTKYKSWDIPAGTPVSMTTVDVHHDEDIYPNSHSLIPERWLDSPKTGDGSSLDPISWPSGKVQGLVLESSMYHLSLQSRGVACC
jgi:cytochrome P450